MPAHRLPALGTALCGLALTVPVVAHADDGTASASVSASASTYAYATASAPTSDDKRPAVSIALTDGVSRARPGDRLHYTVTVRNDGSRPVEGLRVEQRMPDAAHHAAAGQGAKVRRGTASWRTDVAPGRPAELTSTLTLGAAGAGALRAGSTVCAYRKGSDAPLVCASDLDLLTAPAAAGPEAATKDGASWGVWTAGGVLAAGGAVFVVLRGRRARVDVG
ncbi:DUF11 domain-containing protein [Streptomyces sp. SID8379]|uniref:DUF11 domain-containing protein n=1 Tax=unclassified Streptomyces TaxID=2593676 RepID=UPI0003818ECF|nr:MULTISPECIES: DUF11 domain-containing protein [unclassified Streptomyces]MYW68797.1 DUF11 domain-containing protein [Streptomyces sp. SID8379]